MVVLTEYVFSKKKKCAYLFQIALEIIWLPNKDEVFVHIFQVLQKINNAKVL